MLGGLDVLTVDVPRMNLLRLLPRLALVLLLYAGVTSCRDTSERDLGSQLVSISVTPTQPSMASGTSLQFTATGSYMDNSTEDLTASVVWSCSEPAVCILGTSGFGTAGSVGTATITATHGANGISGSTDLTVTTAILVSIAVTSSRSSIALGTTLQYTAMGTFTDSSTQDLTGSLDWSSSNNVVASVQGGLASADSIGLTKITATDLASGIHDAEALRVTAAVLVSISVMPTNPSIALGTTQQFTATGIYSDNSTQDLTSSATWSSSIRAVATASNAPGSNGLATSVAVGLTTITATDPASGINDSTTLTVTAAVLVSISVMPTNPSIALGTTQQFTATGIYSDNSTQDLTSSATWSSSIRTVATISNAPGSNGFATSVAIGFTTITATDPASGIDDSSTLTVTAAVLVSISVTPTNPSIALGTTQQFTATGTYSDSSTQDLTTSATWSSSIRTVSTISNAPGSNGLATSVAIGFATITATDPASGIDDSSTLEVTAAVLVSISVTPTSPSIALGTTQQFTATGTYSDNSTQDLTTSATWSSSIRAVATISNAPGSNGLATSVGDGTTTITATDVATGVDGSTTLRVITEHRAAQRVLGELSRRRIQSGDPSSRGRDDGRCHDRFSVRASEHRHDHCAGWMDARAAHGQPGVDCEFAGRLSQDGLGG